MEVLEVDAEVSELLEKRRDAGLLAFDVERIRQHGAVFGQLERKPCELLRDGGKWCLQLERQLPLAELLHEGVLLLDEDELSAADDADPVGHLLGFLDVVR